jgi:molybdate transport system substrate-binding protein
MKRITVFALMALILFTPAANADSKLTIFAASSLTESFTQIGKNFENSHKGIKVIFSFQASPTLANQIKAGAPADLFVSAEPFSGGTDYVKNRVVLAVPKNSKLATFTDLNNGVKWIQCAHVVPCGEVADNALKSENVTSKPVSLEPKVSSAVAKLVAGEVDAAIIYKTDVMANPSLRAIEFKDLNAATTTYQIASLSKNRWAATFKSYLQSKKVIRQLTEKGFQSI